MTKRISSLFLAACLAACGGELRDNQNGGNDDGNDDDGTTTAGLHILYTPPGLSQVEQYRVVHLGPGQAPVGPYWSAGKEVTGQSLTTVDFTYAAPTNTNEFLFNTVNIYPGLLTATSPTPSPDYACYGHDNSATLHGTLAATFNGFTCKVQTWSPAGGIAVGCAIWLVCH